MDLPVAEYLSCTKGKLLYFHIITSHYNEAYIHGWLKYHTLNVRYFSRESVLKAITQENAIKKIMAS